MLSRDLFKNYDIRVAKEKQYTQIRFFDTIISPFVVGQGKRHKGVPKSAGFTFT